MDSIFFSSCDQPFPWSKKNVDFIDIWLLTSTYYTCSHEPQLLQGQHLSCLSSNLSSENEILRFLKPLWLNPFPFDFKNIENSLSEHKCRRATLG